MNVLVLVPFEQEYIDRMAEAAGPDSMVIQHAQGLKGTDLAEALEWADVVVGEPDPAILADAKGVKLVQMTWAGTDIYTRGKYPFPAGTALCNARGSYGHIISQYVVGQILSIGQNLAGYHTLQLQEVWGDLGCIDTLEDATVLIYGAGNIGSETARRLSGFDTARIIGVCRDTGTPRDNFDELVTLEDAEALLPEADVVVGSIPNSDETAGYLDERRLRMMKPGAILVNVGRGNFIDNDALARVLADGHLRGAALDVTCPEPLPAGHPLWKEPRCLITPHVSGGAFRHPNTVKHTCNTTCENLRRLGRGEDTFFNQVL